MDQQVTATLPYWQLDTIYPGLDSPAFVADRSELNAVIARFESLLDDNRIGLAAARSGPDTAAPSEGDTDPTPLQDARGGSDESTLLAQALEVYLRLSELGALLGVYLSLRVATDSFDAAAQSELSALRALGARTGAATARFKGWLKRVDLGAAAARHEIVAAHRYPLERYREEAENMLGDEAEALAAALDSTGGSAWAKLYTDLSSRDRIVAAVTDAEVAGDEPEREYGTAELRSLQAHASEDVRRRAFRAELELLGRNQLTFAAAMNGIKGQVGSLARQRGWGGPLEYSLFQHGISRRSLDAMHHACEERFETLHRYLRAKAALLGKDRLAWYDLFAPLPQAEARRFTWEEAQALVLDRFATYSKELAAFAGRALEEGWVDVPPRRGKRGGAFCSAVPLRNESRVMLNFGGNLSDVFTLAHELGHAYHNDCKFRFSRTVLQSPTPMTLAETASIFCETLLFDGLMASASETERLGLLEQNLQHATQLLLDIHTRFLFESEVFERRAERDLSPEEMSAVMEAAQARVFAGAVAEDELHPLMWAHKPHYYSSARSFYNFPYTFGWLFGMGLYARYEAEGDPFRRRYDELLASTGLASASSLASGFGIDIEDPQFWRESLAVVANRVDAFEAITVRSEGRA